MAIDKNKLDELAEELKKSWLTEHAKSMLKNGQHAETYIADELMFGNDDGDIDDDAYDEAFGIWLDGGAFGGGAGHEGINIPDEVSSDDGPFENEDSSYNYLFNKAKPSSSEFRQYLENLESPDSEELVKQLLNENENENNTNVSSIAKSIVSNDIGREL